MTPSCSFSSPVTWFCSVVVGTYLGLGIVEDGVASGTVVRPLFVVLVVLACSCPLGPFLPQNAVLLGSQNLSPLFVRLDDFWFRSRICHYFSKSGDYTLALCSVCTFQFTTSTVAPQQKGTPLHSPHSPPFPPKPPPSTHQR